MNPHAMSLALLSGLFLAQSCMAQLIELASPEESKQPTGRFGWAVKGLSDLTGDGIGELVVSTTETINHVPEAGSVYILYGHDFSAVRRLVSPEPTRPSGFGSAVTESAESPLSLSSCLRL